MNERIRELANRIWAEEYWINPNTDKLLPAQLNRFAELIVGESMKIAQEYDGAKLGGPGLIIAMRIEQHFGVEQ